MALPASPSVVVLENDQSIYTPNLQSSVVGVVGFADKGPTNKATLVTSQSNLLNTFGKPSSNIPGQGLEGALEILEATNQLYFVRVVNSNAESATNSDIKIGTCPAIRIASGTGWGMSDSVTSLLYTLVDNNGEEIKTLEQIDFSRADADETFEEMFFRILNPEIQDQPVFAAKDSSGIYYIVGRYAGENTRLHLYYGNTYPTFDFQNFIYGGPNDPQGSGIAANYYSSAIGTPLSSWLPGGNQMANGFSGTRTLTNLLNLSSVYNTNQDASSFFSATSYDGIILVQAVWSSLPNAEPLSSVSAIAQSLSAIQLTASGSYTDARLRIYSKYPGAGYNLSSTRDGTIVGLSVDIENSSRLDKINIYDGGVVRESYTFSLAPASANYIDFNLNENEEANISDYVYVVTKSFNGVEDFTPNNFANNSTVGINCIPTGFVGNVTVTSPLKFLKPIEGTYGLSAGNSGYSTTEAGDAQDRTALIGTAATKTGIYALDDDSLNISLALVPGITHQQVQNALITLGETSKNFIALVAPPYGLDNAQEATEWMNGKGTRTAAINNSYAAAYWPWVQVFNYFAGADEWYDPSIFAARQYVYTDAVAEPWFAPAGYRRGRLTKPIDVEVVLNQGDRDVLYTNNLNPISKEVQAGIVIFGQKTAQRLPTALDRVNVRRLMIYIRKVLLQLGKPFQFEPNDALTWELVEDTLKPFIDDLLARRAIVEGNVKCDSTTNTPLRVDRNELWCAVTIKPTKAAETIVFEVNLTNQSATVNG